jgi:hypothetical protein
LRPAEDRLPGPSSRPSRVIKVRPELPIALRPGLPLVLCPSRPQSGATPPATNAPHAAERCTPPYRQRSLLVLPACPAPAPCRPSAAVWSRSGSGEMKAGADRRPALLDLGSHGPGAAASPPAGRRTAVLPPAGLGSSSRGLEREMSAVVGMITSRGDVSAEPQPWLPPARRGIRTARRYAARRPRGTATRRPAG